MSAVWLGLAIEAGRMRIMENLRDLVKKNRSYRRFDGNTAIAESVLLELVDLARMSGSGSNLQPLKFVVTSDTEQNRAIYPCLAWAGYLADWDGPVEAERPTAYVVILGDTSVRTTFGMDPGIAAQSILLGAAEKGYGGCMIGSIKQKALREVLAVPESLEILLVIALGKPVEEVVLEDAAPGGSLKYYRDENQVHHVPKRPLSEIVFKDRVGPTE